MARYFARVIRALVVSTLGVGGGVGLLIFVIVLTQTRMPDAFRFALTAGMIIGLIFAVLMLAVFLPLDLSAHLSLAKGTYKEIWELEQTRDLVMEGSIKVITAACRQALLVVPYVTSVQDDMDRLVTRAITGPSWRSSGEEMEVYIHSITDGQWRLQCTSRSRSKNVVFDYGKNFENVETWQNQIKSIIKSSSKVN